MDRPRNLLTGALQGGCRAGAGARLRSPHRPSASARGRPTRRRRRSERRACVPSRRRGPSPTDDRPSRTDGAPAHDAPVGIDDAADAGVGGARQIAPCLDRPHPRHARMLPRRRRCVPNQASLVIVVSSWLPCRHGRRGQLGEHDLVADAVDERPPRRSGSMVSVCPARSRRPARPAAPAKNRTAASARTRRTAPDASCGRCRRPTRRLDQERGVVDSAAGAGRARILVAAEEHAPRSRARGSAHRLGRGMRPETERRRRLGPDAPASRRCATPSRVRRQIARDRSRRRARGPTSAPCGDVALHQADADGVPAGSRTPLRDTPRVPRRRAPASDQRDVADRHEPARGRGAPPPARRAPRREQRRAPTGRRRRPGWRPARSAPMSTWLLPSSTHGKPLMTCRAAHSRAAQTQRRRHERPQPERAHAAVDDEAKSAG